MSGRLTIWIDGREALPVRAIPYVTGWRYSPDVVAESLARATAAPFEKLRNLVAYHRPAGRPVQVMPCEWNAVVVQVKGFEAGLHELRPDIEATDDHVGIAAWEKGAALKLPAGVFVWLDEFLREREADHKRTPDDRPVILAPMLDADTRAAVLEGFEDCSRRGPDADRAMIGYADFVAICHVDDPANFGGFRVEANGLYVDLPPADATLTPEERAAVTWHPTGQYDKPALPLPCTLGQLRAFLPGAGMAGSIDEESVECVLDGKANDYADAHVREILLNGAGIDWQYWIGRMPRLKAMDAARLMSGLDPDRFPNLDEKPGRGNPAEAIESARKILRLAEAHSMSEATPAQWAKWAKENDVAVFPGFLLHMPEQSESEDGAVKVGADGTAKRNEWKDDALKSLWEESILPGMTQKKLAEKYGVTHQSISKQLKRANERFSKTKGNAGKRKTMWSGLS